jgi:putative addiction module component (TIGR02574 family)
MTKETEPSFDDLSVREQIQLVQGLWDRIASNPDAIGPTEAQERELARRVQAHGRLPAGG